MEIRRDVFQAIADPTRRAILSLLAIVLEGGDAQRPDVDLAIDVRHHEFAGDHVAPVRRVAGVVLEPLKEGGDVSAGAQGEVFASHLAETGRVTEVGGDTRDGAGNVDLGGNLILRYAHDGLLFHWLDEFQFASAPQSRQSALCSLKHLNQSSSSTPLAMPDR